MTSRNLRATDDVCEQCGRPIMESVVFIFNRTMAFKIMCPCIRAEIRKRDAELAARQKRLKLERLFHQSRLGEKFREATFERYETNEKNIDIYTKLKDFAYNFESNRDKSIILSGKPGTGKTNLASSIVNHLVKSGISAIFVVVPDLLTQIRDSFNNPEVTEQQIMNGLLSCELLVLDDIGVERHKSRDDWASEKLYQIINSRYTNKKSTVFTTNCGWEELFVKLGARTTTRIVEMTEEHMYYMDGIENYRMRNFTINERT